jgi:acyl carrier protein
MENEKEKKVRQFLKERFGGYDDTIGLTDSLESVVDSMGLFELVSFLEQEFAMNLPNEEFSPQRFATIEGILQVIDEFRTE